MAVAVVHANSYGPASYSGGGTTWSASYTVPSTVAGNALLVFVCQDNIEGTPVTYAPTDNKGNTYHSIFSTNGSSNAGQIAHVSAYVAYNVAAGTTTITVPIGGGCCCGILASANALIAYELSGVGTTNPVDVFNSAGGTQSGLTTSGNITTTYATGTTASEIVVGAVNEAFGLSGGPTFGTDSGFTADGSGSYTGYVSSVAVKSEYQLIASNGTYSATMSVTAGGSSTNSKVLGIVALGPAPTATHIRRQLMLTGVGR